MVDHRSNVSESPWLPLKNPLFRAFWIVTIVSNVGTWMHEVGAGWLMTSLSTSPVYVSLVQAATSLPIFLFALPAGALADIVDRRRYLLGVQCYLVLVALALTTLVYAGVVDADLLVVMTFLMGMGSAMMLPAWAATTPEIIDRSILQPAIALNSIGMNVARAIGPALAGVIIAQAGTATVFAINAVSFFGVVVFLYRWRRTALPTRLSVERFNSAIRVGLRYARHAPSFRAAVIRGIGFFLFGSVVWALLPLIAKSLIGGGPATYGVLVASMGIGAVIGATQLPAVRRYLSQDLMVASASILFSVSLGCLAFVHSLWLVVPVMAVSGMAWIVVLSTLQVTAQLALPDWVRSRGLSIFMMMFMGSVTLGSVAWGQLAALSTLPIALLVAAVGLLATIPLTWRWRLSSIEKLDLTPSMHWPTPIVEQPFEHDRGPVLVTVHYDVAPSQLEAFLEAMQALRSERLRDGAYSWSLFEDTAVRYRFIETFELASWLEHLRQHDRVTAADRDLQANIQQLLTDGTSPKVSHYISPTPHSR